MVELISVISLIVVGAGVGTAVVSKVHSVAMDTKLAEDMEQVNSAIAVYLTGGGSLTGVTDAQAVLNKLKTVTTTENGADRQIMFAKRAMIDQRLAVVTSASSSEWGFWKWSRQKARYNEATKRFEYAADSDPNAILGFALNEALGMAPTVAEQRSMALKQAKVEAWVWDYDPTVAVNGGEAPDEVGVGSAIPPPVAGSAIAQATPPVAVPAPPQLTLASYPLSVQLAHSNEPAITRVIYVPPDGSSTGEVYAGPLSLHPGGVLRAFVDSIDDSVLSDSPLASFTYEPTPETLNFLDTVAADYSYFDLGGAMAPGSPPPASVPSPTIALNTGTAIPALYQHSDHFRVYYTLDGSDPATSVTRAGSAAFAGGYPGDVIGLTPTAFGGGSQATIRYVGISTNSQLFNHSVPVLRSTTARKMTLRPPLFSPPSGQLVASVPLSIDFDLSGSDMPADARIYYQVDGVDPGDQSGEPNFTATLYSGPFTLQVNPGQTITLIARVYPPSNAKNWFDTSPAASAVFIGPKQLLFYGVNKSNNIYSINPLTGATTIVTTALYKAESIAHDVDNEFLYYLEDSGDNSKLGRYNIAANTHTDLGQLMKRSGFSYKIQEEAQNLEFWNGSLYLIPKGTDDLVKVSVGSSGITNIQKAIDIPGNGHDEVLGSAMAPDGTLYYTTKDELLKYNIATLSGNAKVRTNMIETKAMLYHADQGKLYGPTKSEDERIDSIALSNGAITVGGMTNPKIKFSGLTEPSGSSSNAQTVPQALYACLGGNKQIYTVNPYTGANSLYNSTAPFNISALAYDNLDGVLYYIEQTSDPDLPCRLGKLNATGVHTILGNIAAGWTYNPAAHPQNLVAVGGHLYYVTPGTDDIVRIDLVAGGTGIAQQILVVDMTSNSSTFANPGDVAIARDGTLFFVNQGATNQFCRYNLNTANSFLAIGTTPAPYPGLACIDGALYGARGSTNTVERLIVNTGASEGALTTSPLRMFVDFAYPMPTGPSIPSDSLWAIREEAGAGRARLVEFVNYRNLSNNVKAIDWGEIFHEDGAGYKSFSAGGATTGISGMALTDTGDCYVVGNRSVIAGGVTYVRPLFAFNVPPAIQGDRIVANILGDMKAQLQVILGSSPSSSDRITGLSVSPVDDELYAVLDRNTGSSTDHLLRVETWEKDGEEQLSYLVNLGQVNGSGEKSEMTEDIAFSNLGALYLADTKDDRIYSVNPANGAILGIHSTQTNSHYAGLAVHPIYLDIVGSTTRDGLNNQVTRVTSGSSNDTALFNYQSKFGITGIQAMAFFAYPVDQIPSAAPPPPTAPGFTNGHIDVDTISRIAAWHKGTTDGHVHAYDKHYDVLGVDFFNFLHHKLHNINRDIPLGSTKFKIIVGNSALSSGGKLSINTTYNSSDPLTYTKVTDYSNIPLSSLPVYSFDGVSGTTKLSKFTLNFDRNAVTKNDIVATNTGSVRTNKPGKFGEWRNGALTIQAVVVKASGADGFTTNTAYSNGGVQGVATSGLLWECTIFNHHHGVSYEKQ